MWDRSSDAVFWMLSTFGEERELLVLGGELIATVQPDNPNLHVKPLRQPNEEWSSPEFSHAAAESMVQSRAEESLAGVTHDSHHLVVKAWRLVESIQWVSRSNSNVKALDVVPRHRVRTPTGELQGSRMLGPVCRNGLGVFP